MPGLDLCAIVKALRDLSCLSRVGHGRFDNCSTGSYIEVRAAQKEVATHQPAKPHKAPPGILELTCLLLPSGSLRAMDMAEYRGRTHGWLSCRFPKPERVAQAIVGVLFFRGASSGCPFGFPIKIHPDRGTLKRKTPSTPATPADFKCRQAATMGGPAQPGQRRIAPALSNCPRLSRSQGCSEPHESARLEHRWHDKGNAMVFVLQVMYPDL